MSKKNSKTELMDEDTRSPEAVLADQIEEQTGGMPSESTEARLAREEIDQPLKDADFFDYCDMSFQRKGIGIVYYIKKNGKYLTTLNPPCSWDKIRELFGAGHYTVYCKDELTHAFKRQKTEVLDALPDGYGETRAESNSRSGIFDFAPQQSSAPDMSSFLAIMQQQNEQRAIEAREQRIRDEASRREDRERDEQRRKDERESKNDLFKSLAPLLAPVIAAILPKKDDATIDFLKESQREMRSQNEKLIERMERISTEPKKNDINMFDMIKMLNEAKKDGKKEMQEFLELVDERAARRAEEMGTGPKEESTLSLLIKNLGPGIAQLLAAKPGMMPPLPQETQAIESNEEEALEVQAAPAPAPAKTKNEIDQEEIFKTLIPFFSEQFMRMQNNHSVDPGAAARESLGILKTKGFTQDRVIALFKRETLFGVLRAYKVPNTLDSWFNKYYEALLIKTESGSITTRAAASADLKTKSGSVSKNSAPKGDVGQGGGSGRDNGARSGAVSGTSGFVPAESGKTSKTPTAESDIIPLNGHVPGKNAGSSAEGKEQLLS